MNATHRKMKAITREPRTKSSVNASDDNFLVSTRITSILLMHSFPEQQLMQAKPQVIHLVPAKPKPSEKVVFFVVACSKLVVGCDG